MARYSMAAESLGVEIGQVRLVAHSWDVAGALRASCAAAFVACPGMVLDPLVEQTHWWNILTWSAWI